MQYKELVDKPLNAKDPAHAPTHTQTGNGATNGATQIIGNGGEIHQVAGGTHPAMTGQTGIVISDDENQLRGGERGPTLLEDWNYLTKTQHFDHERIPERIIHARGFGAHGYFELTDPLTGVSRAKVLSEAGQKVPVFARFSTVAGNKGSSDVARDVRGFAVKFYTAEGNWDLVGNNIPVFFIQDAIKFTDLIHAAKQEPDRGFPQAQTAHDNFWDFASLMPETTHMLMWVMSDRGIPRSFRMMEGFGVHTFRLLNESGESTYVKFHWRPKLGTQSVIWDEALKISGADPDFHRRDLWHAIDEGNFPEWELAVQLFDDAFAEKFAFDVLDSTKVIPEEILPLRVIGRMVLDRNVDNFFSEIEQVAFGVHNVVPGIDFSNDPLLQGRIVSYIDTQLSRLGGPNYTQIPVNRPHVPVLNNQRDGHMQQSLQKGRVNYSPSSLENDTPHQDPQQGFTSFRERMQGDKLRIRSASFGDHYSQAYQFFYSQTEPEQNHIIASFIFELSKVETKAVRERMVSQLANVDPKIAARVAAGIGMEGTITPFPTKIKARTDLPKSPALSIYGKYKPMLKGRKVGCLVADGTDGAIVQALKAAAKAEGADFAVIAPKVGGAKAANGTMIEGDFQLAGGPSVLFDTVYLALSAEGSSMLSKQSAAVSFVADAYAHLKVIGATAEAKTLLDKAGAMPDAGVVMGGDPKAYLTKAGDGRVWHREPAVRTIF